MQFCPVTTARRSAALLALVALTACENATRPVEPVADRAVLLGGAISAASFSSVSLGNASFEAGYTGWTFDNVDVGAFWTASDGTNSVDMNGFFPGSISQSFSTIPGVQYTVHFDLAGNPGYPQGVKTLEVSAAATQANYSFDTQGRSTSNMGWTPQTFTFTAAGTTTTLMFRSTYSGNGSHPDRAQGAAIDNVRVTTPSTTAIAVTAGQCRNGGWRNLTDDLGNLFKNQGDCVSFVATKGRNKGAGGS